MSLSGKCRLISSPDSQISDRSITFQLTPLSFQSFEAEQNEVLRTNLALTKHVNEADHLAPGR